MHVNKYRHFPVSVDYKKDYFASPELPLRILRASSITDSV